MKNLVVKISFISAIIFASFILVNAQVSDKFTYRDLLNQQKIEREELKQTHKETLDKVLVRQKEELESTDDKIFEKPKVRDHHQEEREKIIQLQKEEREKQMQIQADERKNFKPLTFEN